MGKPLSLDLRSHVVAAVSGGMSCRQAAERFGVSAASAVRWVEAVNTTGTVEAKPQGGDTRSHRIEAFSGVILAAVGAQKDISLVELAELLRIEHDVSFGPSCSATFWMGSRIASSEMLSWADLLPHVTCSRPVFAGGGGHEVDQHDDTRRVGSGVGGAVRPG